jgi:hypothetical protein
MTNGRTLLRRIDGVSTSFLKDDIYGESQFDHKLESRGTLGRDS